MDEQTDVTDWLSRFRQFGPPRFFGRSLEPWEEESMVAAMEILFENPFVPECQVLLATHFLEIDAEVWWQRV